MGLPSKRRTKTSKKERASHFALKPIALVKCGQCGSPIKPHFACPKCGTYKGRTVVAPKTKAKTKAARRAAESKKK